MIEMWMLILNHVRNDLIGRTGSVGILFNKEEEEEEEEKAEEEEVESLQFISTSATVEKVPEDMFRQPILPTPHPPWVRYGLTKRIQESFCRRAAGYVNG